MVGINHSRIFVEETFNELKINNTFSPQPIIKIGENCIDDFSLYDNLLTKTILDSMVFFWFLRYGSFMFNKFLCHTFKKDKIGFEFIHIWEWERNLINPFLLFKNIKNRDFSFMKKKMFFEPFLEIHDLSLIFIELRLIQFIIFTYL